MTIGFREVGLSDAPLITIWKNDEYIREMALDLNSIITEESQKKDIEYAKKSADADYQIIEYNKVPVGYVRIDWMNDEKDYAWLRFALGRNRGEGVASTALTIYLKKLFNSGAHRIEGEVYSYNAASQHVLEKLGFKREGVKRKAHLSKDGYVDVYVYGLLADDLK